MLKKSENHTPLYVRLSDIIKERINNHKYLEGQSIPSELELQKEFAVSRTTVRKALKVLTEQNILIKLPGKGTYVSDQRNELKTPSRKFFSLTESINRTGKKISTRLIDTQEILGNAEQNKFFQLKDGQQLLEISRLRYLDDVPFCVEWLWLPLKFSGLKTADLNLSFHKLLKTNYGIIPGSGKKTFKIAFATREESVLLNVDEEDPLMQIKDFVYDENNSPLYLAQQILRSDKFTYAIDH
ncbi:GntR family transcriptional regulator [Lactobacillus xylocopicola]|uniref:GntR family transcriptional regulator n=1 Tax=Lactobacillus xylocopicola TaxID=2976676 RepID=A0ABM8BFN6_9LACO|nr:GntR family transcriptional regulator [Lactobacillus xylocopicola]BDR60062.1 GntR family transcriptional regulator [Lactobacillus xylocopicola]